MERVKSELASSLLREFGPGCVIELETTDQCIKISLPVSREHVVYVQPDRMERNFLCHYAHVDDMLALEHETNGEILEFKQQNIAQLVRKVQGTVPKDFIPAVMWYVRQAAPRMEMMKGLGGRRQAFPVLETIREAKARAYHYPMTKKIQKWTAPA